MYILLHALTLHAYRILHVAPSSSDALASCKRLFDVVDRLVSAWTSWLSELSTTVNQGGGMYPQGMVKTWGDGLDSLAFPDWSSVTSSGRGGSASIWAQRMTSTASDGRESDHPLVESLRCAILSFRDRFISELGWLVGLHGRKSTIAEHLPDSIMKTAITKSRNAYH